jgi:ribulose-phosphate 3-epimerase
MPKPIEIIPAVLPKSLDDLREHLELLRGAVRVVQVDVVDGRLAPGKTWPYKDSASFEKIVTAEHGLPFWDELDFQFDLMIEDPLAQIDKYMRAGGTQLVLHAKSPGAAQTLQHIVDSREDVSGTYPVRIGVALGSTEQPEALEPFEAQFDFVQVMGIATIGRQGEPFDQHALYLVERLRSRYPELPIQVDGGVNAETIPRLVAAGASRLVAGSAIFGADDPVAAYKELYALANATTGLSA